MDSPTKTTEREESSNKRARTAAVGEGVAPPPATLTKPTQLVACFMHLQGDDNVSYSFEFFRIQDLLDYKTLPLLFKPTRTLPWPDNKENNNFTDHMHVSFLHSSENDDDGLGVLYAVGGVKAHLNVLDRIPETLPNVLTRISLSGGYRMLDVYDTHMNADKLFPLIAEIDHLIYVLSGPTNLFRPSYKVSYNTFEVYNPRDGDKSWKLLSDLPFITYPGYRSINLFSGFKYSHLVLGQKLFVSDMVLSSVYDIASNTWSACHLFSDCHIPPDFQYVPRPVPSDCGPGFPFMGKALLWKGEFLLCMIPDECAPMAAYRIKKDEKLGVEKARPLVLRYEGTLFPYGEGLQLVDIGDDHFALMNCKMGRAAEEYQDMMNIFTFKLETDATDQKRLLVKDLNKRYSKPDEINSSLFVYSFTC